MKTRILFRALAEISCAVSLVLVSSMDLAAQVQSGNYDDDTVMAYMDYEYAPKELPTKSNREVEQYLDDLPRKYEKERHRQRQLDRQRERRKERAQTFQRASYSMVNSPRKRRW